MVDFILKFFFCFLFLSPLLFGGGTSPQLITVTSPLNLANGNISIPKATASVNGYLSSSDWSTFNSKPSAFSVSSPLTYSSNIIGIPLATSLTNGYLSSSDWSLFNSKQAAGNYLTALTSDVSATGPGSVAATVNSVGGSSAASVHSGELLANAATNLNTASTIVKRDSSGNFTVGTITGSLTGHASLDLTIASPSWTGTMNTPLTASRALVTDGSGNLGVSATTAAELLFVNGVTSNIQTQLDSKQPTGNFISALTGDGTATGPGSVAFTLATVNSNTGSFGSSTAIPNFTVNGKGLLTAAGTNAVIAPAGTLTGTTLASNVVTSSLTGLGTIVTGVWTGTTIAIANGGTGATTQQAAINALTGTQSSGTYLRSNGTNASLTAIQVADVPTLNQNTTGTASNITASSNTSLTSLSNLATVGTITSGTWNSTAIGSTYGGLGGDFHLSTGALSISSGTVSAGNLSIGNGGTGQATKSTAFDALSPMTTLGDLTYGGASGTGTRLAGDTSNTRKFLREVSSGGVAAAPAWDTIAAGDVPTLNQNTTGTASNITASSNSTLTTLSALNSIDSGVTANFFIASPNGSTGTMTPRAIVAADIPTLNQNTTGTASNITASSNTSLTSLANLATVGTITSGTWTGTTIAAANGGTGVTSVTTSPTASSFAGWDANSNLSANSFIDGYATTATAAGTTTLTVASKKQQFLTGSTTQTVVLPVVTTLVNGEQYRIVNLSSGVVTVQTSGSNTIQAMGANTDLKLTVKDSTAGTGTTSWTWEYTTVNASVLPVALGGTGQSSNWTNHGTIYASSTTVLSSAATGSSGNVFMSNGSSSDPTMQSLQGNSTALKVPTIQRFTSGSSATYTTPTSPAPLYIIVELQGGGGGGAGSGATAGTGNSGNNTTFGASLTAGAGTHGTTSGATAPAAGGTNTISTGTALLNCPGGSGQGNTDTFTSTGDGSGGMGGTSFHAGAGAGGGSGTAGAAAGTNTGSGGGGGGKNAAANTVTGGGGGAGGYLKVLITSPSATYTYTVGTGGSAGSAGTGGNAGGAGADGVICVTEYYQ